MDLHFLIFATFLYKVLPLTRLLEGPFLLHHSYRGEHVQSSCWLHSLYRSASLIFPLRISSKIIHFHSCSFLMFFFSDVSTDYFCCSVEWCVARRKHSHFGLCEGPSDHRGMPMLNSSKLICSPQRQSREKFLKYCPLLQAACWTNRPTKLFWPWDLAWSVKNRQALASFVFQVARNYLMWHYWQVHGEDPRVQCAKKKSLWGLKRSSLSLPLCKKVVPFLPRCWMSSSHPFLPHWPCTQLLQCKCWTWSRGNFSALSATFEPTNKTTGSLSELPGIPWPLPRLQRNIELVQIFFFSLILLPFLLSSDNPGNPQLIISFDPQIPRLLVGRSAGKHHSHKDGDSEVSSPTECPKMMENNPNWLPAPTHVLGSEPFYTKQWAATA